MEACRQFLINFLIATLIIIQNVKTASPDLNNSTLQLVHILFRHGDRTTDLRTIYPKDPHRNETYYPYGYGELTNEGKQREFKLGKKFRERYDNFLGKIYTPDLLEAFSSDVNRTKASLQLVLAGLFPPVEEQIWETGLNWQPIPFSTLPLDQDPIFWGTACSDFQKLYSELVQSPKVVRELEQHAKILEYISEHSGVQVRSYVDLFFLYVCLETEHQYGLTLPEWTKKVFPQPLQEFAIKSYGLLTSTTELRRFTSGTLLKNIIHSSTGKISGDLLPKNRKLFLYSGHELNIAYMLQVLDVFEPHIPPYGSYILFELHKIDDVAGFKIFYQDYTSSEPKLLKLPACDELCPLDQFTLLFEEYIPQNDICKSKKN
ncbi:venom acid phosphatase Acph-1-like [Tenebrio molitor]|uniref:venom acid phosphatase Acph-1-like n=1 Tax=Tenebrio molitor TaxID=7067 RepID=UPI00362470B9